MHHPELHAAVLAAPDDDRPRLVYADWLTEHGDPRGELIALEVAIAKLPEGDARATELQARRDAVFQEHARAWLPPYRGFGPTWTFRRGFLEEVSDAVNAPIVAGDGPLPDACLRRARLWNPDSLAALETVLAGARLAELDLSMNLAPDALAALLARPVLAHLESLRFRCYEEHAPNADHVRAIVGAKLPNLRRLELECGRYASDIPADVFDVIAGWDQPLRALRLEDCRIGPGALAAVLDRPALASLESLALPGCGLGEQDVAAICASAMPLRELVIAHNPIGPTAARAIAATPRFAALTRLDLNDTAIGDDGLAALCASPYLPRTLQLVLDGELFHLGVDVWTDGTAVTGASWLGQPTGEVTTRFQLSIDPNPRRETWEAAAPPGTIY